MAIVSTCKANGDVVKVIFYRDKDEYVVYNGHKIYATADNRDAALSLYKEIL